jgi:hypothetical protein
MSTLKFVDAHIQTRHDELNRQIVACGGTPLPSRTRLAKKTAARKTTSTKAKTRPKRGHGDR